MTDLYPSKQIRRFDGFVFYFFLKISLKQHVILSPMNEEIKVFTDGSSKGNPGPGGWGAIIDLGEEVRELGGRDSQTTNNRMELTAVVETLEFLENQIPALNYLKKK